MGYLDNSSITVDAVLTKKRREILKNGENLNITSFTMSDAGVDYRLWNPEHPSGSAYYGEAIENLPMLEASVHSEYNLRNRLLSLNQNTVAVPAIQLSGLDAADGTLLTLKEGKSKTTIGVNLVGYSSTSAMAATNPYYYVVQDPTLISAGRNGKPISGTGAEMFISDRDIPQARMYEFSGNSFGIAALQQDTSGKETFVYVVHKETGAYNSFRVINNVTKNTRALLSQVRSS